MTVAEGGRVHPGNAVEVALSLDVPIIQTLGAGHDEGIGGKIGVVLVVEKGELQQSLLTFVQFHAWLLLDSRF